MTAGLWRGYCSVRSAPQTSLAWIPASSSSTLSCPCLSAFPSSSRCKTSPALRVWIRRFRRRTHIFLLPLGLSSDGAAPRSSCHAVFEVASQVCFSKPQRARRTQSLPRRAHAVQGVSVLSVNSVAIIHVCFILTGAGSFVAAKSGGRGLPPSTYVARPLLCA